jgi:hypothetical protein
MASLAKSHPDVAAEWHPKYNGDLTPRNLNSHSERPVWWLCEMGHDYQESVAQRIYFLASCPYCAAGPRKASNGFSELMNSEQNLENTFPEIAAEWHLFLNGHKVPGRYWPDSVAKIWWAGKCGHVWEDRIRDRAIGGWGCPGCTGRNPRKVRSPVPTSLIAEWHPTLNGHLNPQKLSSGSGQMAWWLGSCGHEWKARVAERTSKGRGCPFCQTLKSDKSNLAQTYPEIAGQWHPTLNGPLKPEMYFPNSQNKVWWRCSLDHAWAEQINKRCKADTGCSTCRAEPI